MRQNVIGRLPYTLLQGRHYVAILGHFVAGASFGSLEEGTEQGTGVIPLARQIVSTTAAARRPSYLRMLNAMLSLFRVTTSIRSNTQTLRRTASAISCHASDWTLGLRNRLRSTISARVRSWTN